MQIRLSVLAARDGAPSARTHVPGQNRGPGQGPHQDRSQDRSQGRLPVQVADVLVTAPVGTTLGAVAGALAGAVGARSGSRGGRAATHVHLYAGDQRLDERAVLGHPPLVDGAVLRLDDPDPDHVTAADTPDSPAELRVVGGPDAGGIHLLLPGRVRVGRSAEADVPLDDPDVSRFHLALDVAADGQVTLADLGSTNGTSLDGLLVGPEPRPVPPGALIGLGESALLVSPGNRNRTGRADLIPDGRGRLQVAPRPATTLGTVPLGSPAGPSSPGGPTASGSGSTPAPRVPGSRARGLLARGGERLLRGRASIPGRSDSGGNGQLGGRAAGAGAGSAGAGSADPGSADPRNATRGRATEPGLGQSAGPGTGPRGAAAAAPAGATPPHGVRMPSSRPSPAVDARRWPDPAELLHTALGPGPRLWERGPDHPDALTLRLGSTDHQATPVTVDLRAVGSLGVAGPHPRLSGLARALIAQLAVLHSPSTLELVLIAADPARPAEVRADEWSWLYWLPQLRPTRGQPCRLLTALDPDQALARLTELVPGGGPGGLGGSGAGGGPARSGTHTVLVVDGDPGSPAAREALGGVLAHGPAEGVHALCLAERPDLLPHGCGATAAVTGEVGTLLTLERPITSPGVSTHGGQHRAAPAHELVEGVALDAVSATWAERLARALAPLREPDGSRRPGRGALPDAPRLLDLLGLDLVTPAKLSSRWAEFQVASGALPAIVVGSDRDGPCGLDLTGHLLVGGAPGSGRTELLRSLLASLSVTERPDRLGILLIEGRPSPDPTGGLRPCIELPQVTGYVDGADPLRLVHAAQALLGELDRRDVLLQGRSFASWYAERALSQLAPPRRPADDYLAVPTSPPPGRLAVDTAPPARLLVVVDDHDELLLPGRERAALASALDTVAVRGPRLGIHLVVATGRPDRSSGTDLDEAAHLRIALRTDDPRLSALLIHVDYAASVPEDRPGRGYVRHADGGVTAFQAARVSGRIPRTATLRPTVAPLDWAAMGDPPARRPVRELGNGPTDLALLASALQRAAETLDTAPVPPLL